MSTSPWEALLARLYSDPAEVERFLTNRQRYAAEAGVDAADLPAVSAIDADSLRFAAHSYRLKRDGRR